MIEPVNVYRENKRAENRALQHTCAAAMRIYTFYLLSWLLPRYLPVIVHTEKKDISGEISISRAAVTPVTYEQWKYNMYACVLNQRQTLWFVSIFSAKQSYSTCQVSAMHFPEITCQSFMYLSSLTAYACSRDIEPLMLNIVELWSSPTDPYTVQAVFFALKKMAMTSGKYRFWHSLNMLTCLYRKSFAIVIFGLVRAVQQTVYDSPHQLLRWWSEHINYLH